LKRIFLFCVLTVLAVGPALAAEAMAQLQRFNSEMTTLKAEFSQRVFSDNGELQQQASGQLHIQRPGRFRWDYQEPYQQLILADGSKLWIYDEDLEQVTVKNIDEALGQTPAMLLSGGRDLEQEFHIIELGEMEGSQQWVELTPKAKDSSFIRMRLGFLNGELHTMELLDGFNNLTVVVLNQVVRNDPVRAGMFRFDPPAGVDVIGDIEIIE